MARLLTDVVVIQPDRPLPWEWRRSIVGILMLAIIAGWIGYRFVIPVTLGKSSGADWLAMLICGVGVVLLVACAWLFNETSIIADGDQIRFNRWSGYRAPFSSDPPIRLDRADIDRIVLVSVDIPKHTHTARQPAVFFFNREGRCIVCLYPCRFRAEDLAQVWEIMNVAPEGSWADVIPQHELDSHFPNAFDADGNPAAS